MSFLDPQYQQERVKIYRLFGYLFMNIPEMDIIEEFEVFAGIPINDSYEEICDDFIRLFIEGELQNYEGFYREILYKELPIEPSLSDVKHFYWTAGIDIEEEFDLSADHISMELIFMSCLIERNLKELEIEFLKRLCEWIPLFCDNLYEKAGTDFFKEVATSLQEFISSECESIGYE